MSHFGTTPGSFDAEQGLAGASTITVVTKSGTNDYHGSAYEYHDNQQLKSRPFFMPAKQKKPVQTLNIFGGTFGGAIVKNKLFYFDSDGWASLSFNWAPVIGRNYVPASYDRRHVFQLAFLYELPLGKGKPFLNSGIASAILGGWQLNGNTYAYTGTPFTITASGASLNAPGNSQTADQVLPSVKKLGGIGPGHPYYDRAAFAPVTQTRFGTSGRNLLRRPGLVGIDGSISRNFSLTEKLKMEIRAESFNLTNTPQFGKPNSSITGSNFMWITSAGGERQIRFAARLSF